MTLSVSSFLNVWSPLSEVVSQPPPWSARIAERYQCTLAPDLADWFDREIWKRQGTGEFRVPISPAALLSDAAEEIWPGLMPCDLLPILADDDGNWVCVRADPNNQLSEMVQWFHGGGDWMPWGKRLADTIVFEAVLERLPGPRRRLAVPAENPKQGFDPLNDPFVHWAFEHQSNSIRELLTEQTSAEESAEILLGENIAAEAVRCELVQDAMHQPWSNRIDSKIASKLGLAWNDCVSWMFDGARIPADAWRRLKDELNVSDHDRGHQDWSAVETHCRAVIEHTSDTTRQLAWAWDLLGYALERRDDRAGAIRAYQRGASASSFTDQAVRMNSHWMQSVAVKFSVARLQKLAPELVQASTYLSSLLACDTQSCRHRVVEYWIDQADGAKDPRKSYEQLMHAGWDVGVDSFHRYATLLDRIAITAEASGQHARAMLAKTHRCCLQNRYGI
ncbi:MAG: SMI1/KNR4 family protein [Novipirellula sp. JB048]